MKSKQPKQKPGWMDHSSKSKSDVWGPVGCSVVLFLGFIAVLAVPSYIDLKKREEQRIKLQASGAKAMELCRAWSKGQSTYTNKPGLRLYRQMDDAGKAIPGKNFWMRDPDEFPMEVPSAVCFKKYIENDLVEVKGAIIGDKYTSETWPCHRGYKLNTNYKNNNKYDKKYIKCLFDPDVKTNFSSGSHVYEIKEIWRFDLDGNQIR